MTWITENLLGQFSLFVSISASSIRSVIRTRSVVSSLSLSLVPGVYLEYWLLCDVYLACILRCTHMHCENLVISELLLTPLRCWFLLIEN